MNHHSHSEPDDNHRETMPSVVSQALKAGAMEEFDVRPLLEAGQELFRAIMQRAQGLQAGQVLHLIVPFEPVPLHSVMARQGFAHWKRAPEQGSPDPWEIFYFQASRVEPDTAPAADEAVEDVADDGDVIDLDVRGLEPPEPLERVMEMAGQLGYGHILRVFHHRNPVFLFDLLEERGFSWRSRERSDEEWEIRIWRKS